jgi:hypothetical protein
VLKQPVTGTAEQRAGMVVDVVLVGTVVVELVETEVLVDVELEVEVLVEVVVVVVGALHMPS